MESVWNDSVNLPKFKTLEDDISTDVLIIGGGMAGILCAYILEGMGVDYILAEAKTIGSGITKNTTAKITSQHGLIYDQLINSLGVSKAGMYLKANEQALRKYKKICKDYDCDYEEKDAFVYSMEDAAIIQKEVTAANKLGLPARFVKNLPLPFTVAGAVMFEQQAQFHPLKFIAGIAKGLNIYENTFVKEVKEHTARTNKGAITAKKIIVATHFPFINKHGNYVMKMYQERSYVLALEHAMEMNGMYIDASKKGLSFRNYKHLLLVGGGQHRTGKSGGNWDELRTFAKKYYPDSTEKYSWATQDCMTLDDVPYIGSYSSTTPDLYVATGFNKWGMTTSMAAAMILSDLVAGRKNDYAGVFAPRRNILKRQLIINGGEAICNWLTITDKRCPHLGCALKWNKAEHTWDCPCHGSRFQENGTLIDNPSMNNCE